LKLKKNYGGTVHENVATNTNLKSEHQSHGRFFLLFKNHLEKREIGMVGTCLEDFLTSASADVTSLTGLGINVTFGSKNGGAQ